MNKQELIDKYTAEISRLRPYCPNRHLISEQLKYDLYKEILEDLKQLDEPHKPVVPKFFDDWANIVIAEHDKFYAISLIARAGWGYGVNYELGKSENPSTTRELLDWLVEDSLYLNKEKAINALLYGYEVEKEPLYEVIIGDLYLIKKFNNRNDFCFDTSCSLCAWEKSAYQLTEAEIKSIDERYWPFAVPVEEVAEG